MEIAFLLLVTGVLTAVLVMRELRRNRQAREVLSAEPLVLRLAPPWSAAGRPTESLTEGTWSAWYREGVLGAYLATHATLRNPDGQLCGQVSAITLAIVEQAPTHQSVLVSVSLPVEGVTTLPGGDGVQMDIDAHISTPMRAPEAAMALVLTIRLSAPPRTVERRLCLVEHRFAASGIVNSPA